MSRGARELDGRSAPSLQIAAAQEFASSNEEFLATFVAAWVKVANADRFAGKRNLCDAPPPSWTADERVVELAGAGAAASASA